MKPNKYLVDLALMGVTASWAVAMIFMKYAAPYSGSSTYIGFRMGVGAILLSIIFWKKFHGITKPLLKAGFLIGLCQFLALTCVNLSLRYTTMTNAGFITSLFVVFTPIFMIVINKTLPSRTMVMSIFIATVGLAVLCLDSNFSLQVGDLIALAATFIYCFVIIFITKYSHLHDPIQLLLVQTWSSALCSIPIIIIMDHNTPFIFQSEVFWFNVVAGSILINLIAGVLQNNLQKLTSENRAALIYSTVPVYTAIFGYLIFNEVINWQVIVGGGLIMMAIFYEQTVTSIRQKIIIKDRL